MTGQLFLIAAPSGAGKTSLVKALTSTLDSVAVSISHTTRAARPGEEHGCDYYFVDRLTFEQMIAENEFLEYAQVFGNFYGTTQVEVEQRLQEGLDIILEIDWQGAQQIRQKMPDNIGIYILPPSLKVLRTRLQNRGQDDPDVIQRRMQQAQQEMSHYPEFDYLIINDDFDNSLAAFQAIVTASRYRQSRQFKQQQPLLQQLLS